MTVKVIPLVCPNCGGQIHVEEGTKQFYCTYCGTQLMLDTNEKRFLFTKHVINEAKMIEARGRSRAMVIDAKERAKVDRIKARNDRIRAWSDYQSRQVDDYIRLAKLVFPMLFISVILIIVMKLVSLI